MMGLKDQWAAKEKAFANRKVEAPAPATAAKPKGSPVASAAASHGAVTHGKIAMLEHQIKELRAGSPRLMLDPAVIHPSRWANRHELSFAGLDFQQLKDEIAGAGKNVQPIKVRPLGGKPGEYEIVFGHRRHRACLELGLPVEAMIESMDDQALFAEMDRENRVRADLRPYEQGLMYRRALDEGLFPSLRQMAEKLGVDVSAVSKARDIAALPQFVLDAFSSPLAIQFRWSVLLKEALKTDADAVKARALEIVADKKDHPQPDSKVLNALCGIVRTQPQPKKEEDEDETLIIGKTCATASFKKSKQHYVFEIRVADLPKDKLEQLTLLIADLI
jgi:ParB family chromosome partitioning protein